MKITIDKQLTTLDKVERTKNHIKEFKEIYMDSDLLRLFEEATGETVGFGNDIIRCNLSAFPGGTMETDETHYRAEILLEQFHAFVKVWFYISQSGVVRSEPVYHFGERMDMYGIERYTLQI